MEEERCADEREQIIKDPECLADNYPSYSYLARGLYADQMEIWFQYYNRDQFLVLTTEDFAKNPQQTLNQFFDFVDVCTFQVGNLMNLQVGNYKNMGN